MNIRLRTAVIAGVALALSTLSGCAKFPSTTPTVGKELVVTIRVRGRISPTDILDPSIRRYYFIAIDNDANQNTGPWAVVAPPYGGNGWVTSAQADKSIGVTSFLEYDAANPGGYIYNILAGSFFLNTSLPQPPIRYELLDGGATVRFTIDFSQIATSAIPADQIRQLDVNIITTNELAINPNSYYPTRQWDALGPTGQDYVTVDTTNDRLYYGDDTDSQAVTDPDLDIDYWSIQVQTVSSR